MLSYHPDVIEFISLSYRNIRRNERTRKTCEDDVTFKPIVVICSS